MIPLTLLPSDGSSRVRRDRLELLTALLTAPNVEPLYRDDVIVIPPQHPTFAWQCMVQDCERGRRLGTTLCSTHIEQWGQAKGTGTSMAEFRRSAQPLLQGWGQDPGLCLICPERPAHVRTTRLCLTHDKRWRTARRGGASDFAAWATGQPAFTGFGRCRVTLCPYLADSAKGLCLPHKQRWRMEGESYEDQVQLRRWCEVTEPIVRVGVINLIGLPALVKTEIQWGLFAHTQIRGRSTWDLTGVQRLANHARRHRFTSLMELDTHGADGLTRKDLDSMIRMICYEIVCGLRCVYYSPQDTKEAGFIETDHFGRRFHRTRSHFDLTSVSQRWLRDLLWDHLANSLSSTRCPRSRSAFDVMRRACAELSAFLENDVPDGGHDPAQLRQEHAQRFVADQRHRARHGLPSIALVHRNGRSGTVTDNTHRFVFNGVRKLLFGALESGTAGQLGLDPGFITAIPHGGDGTKRPRSPFSDEVARALADEANLQRFSQDYDLNGRGLRDVWEAIVVTGRRCSEVLELRWDCIGRYRGLPMLWHDQTKVGNYNEGIRIPEALYDRLDQRRRKTLTRFEHRHGRLPTAQERAIIALFPSDVRNVNEDKSLSYPCFWANFREWVNSLDLGAAVAHQARHTLATNLLRAGASLAHIRRYLGHVSDRMAEHYVKIAASDLEDVLHAVWVAGPGAANPGKLLSGESTPLTRGQALALALDLSRRSTPADGGFCTFQPVVQGGACPWKLDCENCDKFVLSGADLLYWRRKQEQWRSIAERAPDNATADYLHQVFEPTARAIAGLEKALAGLGLLDQALAMDLRRPQDYFHRIWSTNFRATDLADLAEDDVLPELTSTERSA